MIKRLLIAVAIALPLFASAQTVKIGLVDVTAIMSSHPDTQAAQTKLNETQKKDDLPAIKERKAKELADYQTKIQQFEQSAGQDMQKLQAELMQPILAKIQQAIESVGKEGGYTIIQNLDPQIIFYHAAPAVDITADVKAKLGMK